MPKQLYRCENSGALCPHALAHTPFEVDTSEQWPCTMRGCCTDATFIHKAEKRATPRVLVMAACAIFLTLVAGLSLFLYQRGPDPGKADSMISDYYPELPKAPAGGAK